jgi:predicted secreted protein
VIAMPSKLTASLREAPVTVPALGAIALFVVWATSEAGYPVTHWAPGGLIVLLLVAIAAVCIGVRWAEINPAVKLAVGCLAGYTALSFCSILWAGVQGAAWEGANRTLLYLLVFSLFACWPQRARSAALLLGAWTMAMIGLAVFVALHLDGATGAGLQSLIPGGRLAYPSGYPNASAAQWLMAFWPALLLARSERLAWWLRGLLAGGAVLLADVALLSQSRGSLYATPVMLVLLFALIPGRTRTFALLVPVGAGVVAAAPAVLRVGDHLQAGAVVASTTHHAIVATFVAAFVVGVVVAVGALVESRLAPSTTRAGTVHRALGATGLATLALVLVGGTVAVGNPVSRLEHAWHTFKVGYAANSQTGSRLVSGLGSNRYDFYRVALDEFLAHPVLGIGVDNFQEQYLLHGRSTETPHYPHSVELRTLVQTGIVGSLLALVGLGAALWAAVRALRLADPLARSVVVAALAGFAYWVIHGSFDWFWEYAGLGAPAFALRGGAWAVGPGWGVAGARALGRRPTIVLAALLALAAACSLIAPWLSQLEIQSAAHVWTRAPQASYARLDDAARLDPLSDEASLVAGSIALRYGELARADRDFAQALQRSPDDAYATLELGAIASARGDRSAALGLLERATRLSPREALTREALGLVLEGRLVNIQLLNREILLKAQELA